MEKNDSRGLPDKPIEKDYPTIEPGERTPVVGEGESVLGYHSGIMDRRSYGPKSDSGGGW